MRGRAHVILDTPAAELILEHVERGDVVVDLTIMGPAGALGERLVRERQVDWVRTEVATDESMRAARAAIVELMERAPDLEVSGQPLSRLLSSGVDGMYNYWWALNMTRRSVRLDDFPRALMRSSWLGDASARAYVLDALAGASEVMIWCAHRLSAVSLVRRLELEEIKVVSSLDGSEHETKRSPRVTSAWRFLKRCDRARRFAARARAMQTTQPAQHVDVLIPTFRSYWRDDIFPVERYIDRLPDALRRRGYTVSWLPLASFGRDLAALDDMTRRQDVPADFASIGLESSVLAGHIQDVAKLRRRVLPRLSEIEHLEGFGVGGVSLGHWLRAELQVLLDGEALRFLHLHHVVREAVERLSPRVVLYKDEFYLYGRAISSGVAAAGGVAWAYQHGLITEDHWTYRYSAKEWEGDDPIPTPTTFLAYGEYARECVTGHGAPPERVVDFGSWRHDEMFARARAIGPADRAEARRKLGIAEDLPLFVIFTQLVEDAPEWVERTIRGLRDAGLRAHVAVKQHPRHRVDEELERVLDELDWADASLHAGELDLLLRAADVALTENSTTGLEAAIFGAPLICLRTPGRYESFPFVSDGIALDAPDVEAMAAAASRVLEPGWRAGWEDARLAFFERHMVNVSAPASDLLCDMLDAMD